VIPARPPASTETRMNQAQILDVVRETIIVILKLGGPSMVLALIVGVTISLFQSLTQIQEATLTFMPKIVVIFVALLILLPFMIDTMTAFTHDIVDRIVKIE
jgi:flagellar biosynthetic protein FliQ